MKESTSKVISDLNRARLFVWTFICSSILHRKQRPEVCPPF